MKWILIIFLNGAFGQIEFNTYDNCIQAQRLIQQQTMIHTTVCVPKD